MILSIMMHPMKYIHTLPSLQIPRRPSDLSLPFWDPNFLGALHVGNNLLWHSNAFGPIVVGLLIHLDSYHLVIFILLQEIRCGVLLVHLVGVGVGELACLLFVFLFLLFLPHASPCTHRTCGLPCGTSSKPWFLPHQASSLS